MSDEMRAKLERSKLSRSESSAPNPELAAREVLRFLLTYAVLENTLSLHPPELVAPETHKKIRETDSPTWGVMWEDGPHNWAVNLSTGVPLAGNDPLHSCETIRHGCTAEPHYGFDLFWYPNM